MRGGFLDQKEKAARKYGVHGVNVFARNQLVSAHIEMRNSSLLVAQ